MRSLRAWCLLVVTQVIVLGLLLAPDVGQTQRAWAGSALPDQGLEDGWAVGNAGQITGGQLLIDQLGIVQQAGAGWTRLHFRLGRCFVDWTTPGCNGTTALQTYEQVVSEIEKRGLRILGLVSAESWRGQASDWTEYNAEFAGGSGLNPYITGFSQDAAGLLAAHFGQRIQAWEIWNEPNAWDSNPAPGMYTGGTFLYPSNFAQLLTAAARAIRASAPDARIISGGLLATDVGGAVRGAKSGYRLGRYPGADPCPSILPSGGDYLCSTYDRGRQYAGWDAGSPFTDVGQHLYLDQDAITSASRLSDYLTDLRAVYLAYGGEAAGMQTHITEIGWSTLSVTEGVQAYNLTVAYQLLRPARTAYVARAYWFRAQDLIAPGDGYGLFDVAGKPKLAMQAYQRWAAGD